jgi:hypothetical protein
MEDFFVLNNIVTQGFKGGFMSINKKAVDGINMVNGRWLLADGAELGSSWDIILNPDFAKIIWKDDYKIHLTEMVLMSHIERVNYLHSFVKEEEKSEQKTSSEFIVTSEDGLMNTIQQSLLRVKEYSEGLYIETCNSTYENLFLITNKTSVTELNEKDFLIMNSMESIMGGALAEYFARIAKPSFSVCPECGTKGFKHEEGCSIERKSNVFLTAQNDGC